MIITVVSALLAILVGAIITWFVGRHSYHQAGKELKEEAAELQWLTTLVLRSMENAGLVKLNRDESGKIIGIVFKEKNRELHIKASTSVRDE